MQLGSTELLGQHSSEQDDTLKNLVCNSPQIMSRNVSADSVYVIVMNCIVFVQIWGLKYASSSFFPIASHTYHVKPHANKSHFDSNLQDTCPAAAFLMTTRLLQALETPLGK